MLKMIQKIVFYQIWKFVGMNRCTQNKNGEFHGNLGWPPPNGNFFRFLEIYWIIISAKFYNKRSSLVLNEPQKMNIFLLYDSVIHKMLPTQVAKYLAKKLTDFRKNRKNFSNVGTH